MLAHVVRRFGLAFEPVRLGVLREGEVVVGLRLRVLLVRGVLHVRRQRLVVRGVRGRRLEVPVVGLGLLVGAHQGLVGRLVRLWDLRRVGYVGGVRRGRVGRVGRGRRARRGRRGRALGAGGLAARRLAAVACLVPVVLVLRRLRLLFALLPGMATSER